MSRIDELVEYYDNHDDIENGVYLLNKKYWYIYYGVIHYGYVDGNNYNAYRDGSCENRVTYYGEDITFKIKDAKRHIKKFRISDTKEGILLKFAKCLKEKGDWRLKRLAHIYPEYLI